MDKNILFKSLLQGVVGMLLLALVLTFVNHDPFLVVLAKPYTILMGIAAVVGCYIGYTRKAKKNR